MYYLCCLLILILGTNRSAIDTQEKQEKSNSKQEKSNSNEKTNFEDGSLSIIIVCFALCISRPQTTRSAISILRTYKGWERKQSSYSNK